MAEAQAEALPMAEAQVEALPMAGAQVEALPMTGAQEEALRMAGAQVEALPIAGASPDSKSRVPERQAVNCQGHVPRRSLPSLRLGFVSATHHLVALGDASAVWQPHTSVPHASKPLRAGNANAPALEPRATTSTMPRVHSACVRASNFLKASTGNTDIR